MSPVDMSSVTPDSFVKAVLDNAKNIEGVADSLKKDDNQMSPELLRELQTGVVSPKSERGR